MEKLLHFLIKNSDMEEYIMDKTSEQIESLDNKEKNIFAFIDYYTENYEHADCDYIEMLDYEGPDYELLEIIDNRAVISLGLFTGANVWFEEKNLGKVTITIEGKYSFKLLDKNGEEIKLEPGLQLKHTIVEINDFKIEELNCEDQYFDDHLILNL